MKKLSGTLLASLFVIAGVFVIAEILIHGVYERTLGNVGVPPVLDLLSAIGLIAFGGLTLKTLWVERVQKDNAPEDH